MPLIPGINQPEIKLNAANTPSFAVRATEDEFGNAIGKSMLALGTGLSADAEAVGKLEPQRKKSTDGTQAGDGKEQTSAQTGNGGGSVPSAALLGLIARYDPAASNAVDLTNQYKGQAQSLQSDFFQLSGKSAVEALPEAMKNLSQLQSDVLATAASPAAAGLAQAAITGWGNVLQGSILRHALAQQRVYDDDLDGTQIAQSREAVRLLYNDDGNFLVHLHTAVGARVDQVLRQAKVAGGHIDTEAMASAVTAAKAEIVSDLTAARIMAALDQGDLHGASALHQRWSDDLLAGDRAVVARQLGAARHTAQLGEETRRVLTAAGQN